MPGHIADYNMDPKEVKSQLNEVSAHAREHDNADPDSRFEVLSLRCPSSSWRRRTSYNGLLKSILKQWQVSNN